MPVIGGYEEYIPLPYIPMKIGNVDISAVPTDSMFGLTLVARRNVSLLTLPQYEAPSKIVATIPPGFPIGEIFTYIIKPNGKVYWQVRNNQFYNPVGSGTGNANLFWVFNLKDNFDQDSIQAQQAANQAAANIQDTGGPFDFLTDIFKPNTSNWIPGVPNFLTVTGGIVAIAMIGSIIKGFQK